MAKILTSRRFGLWWQMARRWFKKEHTDILAAISNITQNISIDIEDIDTTVVALESTTAKEATLTAGVADIKGDVAVVKDKVENIDFSELAKDATVAKDSTVAKQATMVSLFAGIEGNVGNVRGDTKLLRSYIALPKHITVFANNNTYVCDFYQLDKSYSAWKPQNQDGIVIRVYEPIEAGVSCTVITPTSQYGGTITTIGKLVSLSEILSKFDDIDIDTTTLAKQGTNPNATLTEVQAKIGTPASGQPSTLFAAIAASGGGGATPSEVVDNSVASKALNPNKLYIFTNRTNDLTISLNAGEQGVANEYHFFIEVGGSLPTITFPSSLTWVAPLSLAVNKSVEISILNNSAVWV